MCVASLLAHNALYTVFLHLVAKFQIFPADGKRAEEAEPLKGLRELAFVGNPKGFQAKFVPREGSGLPEWLERPNGN